MDRRQRLLVVGDLLGQRLVLFARVDVVAHLGQHVGERAARQERFEQRRSIAVIGVPYPLGQLGATRSQVGPLGGLLRLHRQQLGIEIRKLGDEVLVIALDRGDPALERRDLVLDVGQVGVDPVQLHGRVMDVGRQVRLDGREVGDPRPLRGDILLELGLPGAGGAQLVAIDARRVRRRADHANHQREEEEEEAEAAAEASTPGCGPSNRGPAIHGRTDPAIRRAALLQGDVIVRANSEGRPGSRRTRERQTATPAGGSPSGVGTTRDDTGLRA